MFYDVHATLHFTDPDEAVDFYHDCQLALPKASVVNPDTDEQECSFIERLDNHHDLHPHQPCIRTHFQDNCP